MTELWLPVVGFEGTHEVSDHGRVRSVDRVIVSAPSERVPGGQRRLWRGHILSQYIGSHGYPIVALCGERLCVHVLVAEAFHGLRPDGMECRHLDGNSKNNRAANLCWGTPKQNGEDRARHGRLRGSRNGQAKLTEEQVRAIRADTRFQAEIGADYGVSQPLVSQIKRGLIWKEAA